jgi:cell division protein FtsQ
VVLLLGAASWWLLTSSTFAVARVESGPYRYTDEDDLQAAFTRCLGRNIWTLSSEDVRRELASLPWVRDLTVRRRLPSSIAVEFQEWRPILAVPAAAPGGVPRLLLDNGRVLDQPAHLDPPGLPLLVDAPLAEDPSGGWRLQDPEARSVLALTEALANTGFEAVAPVDFVLCRPEGFQVVLQSNQGRLQVGRENFRERLERYLLTRAKVPAGVQVDLRFRDRVSFLPAAAMAADSTTGVTEVQQ